MTPWTPADVARVLSHGDAPYTPVTMPNTMPTDPVPTTNAPSDNKVTTLHELFPDIEEDVLGAMLAHHDNSIEATVATLLDICAAEESHDGGLPRIGDTDFARSAQAEHDEAMARAVHAELQAELKAEKK